MMQLYDLSKVKLAVTPDDVQAHIKNVLSAVNLRMLIAGNIYKDEAIKIAEMAEQGLGRSTASPDDLSDRALLLPEGPLSSKLNNNSESNFDPRMQLCLGRPATEP